MSLLGKTRPKSSRQEMPLLAIRDFLVFPRTVSPFLATTGPAMRAVEAAMGDDRRIFLVPQKSEGDARATDDLHPLGTICHILQVIKLPDQSLRILLEGLERGRLDQLITRPQYYRGRIKSLELDALDLNPQGTLLMESIQRSFLAFSEHNRKLPRELKSDIQRAESPDLLVDLLVPHMALTPEKKLEFLLETRSLHRLERLAVALEVENEIHQLQQDIQKRVKQKMEDTQKEYFLNEQIREIQKELGQEDADPTGVQEFRRKLEQGHFPLEVQEKGLKETQRLARLQPQSPEAGIIRHYLEWLTDLPWNRYSQDNTLLDRARTVLDHDHFDMNDVKERILDFIAVRQIQDRHKGPILCLVGPPGTGKTSLGRSIARALGRNFVRISLGGVRDEAEIRGHRKTYIGALPGKIIQSMKKAGSSNPVFLLDEIDKMSHDFRGDPAAALLEVLDPEQNSTFLDHYLEVPYDLSHVMFITTANSLHEMSRPLLDRMEVIEVPGYSEHEKVQIAQQFIIPKQKEENGLSGLDIRFTPSALSQIIRGYTLESGVRSLERHLARCLRKIVREVLQAPGKLEEYRRVPRRSQSFHEFPSYYQYNEADGGFHRCVQQRDISRFLGDPPLRESLTDKSQRPGVSLGLAWTENGGKVLSVEAGLFPGKGELILTGSLGDVMKESARIAYSLIRSLGPEWGIAPQKFQEMDLHLHFPAGAIPKDGPSAGITILTALFSVYLDRPLPQGTAMTGEVTLSGRILPVGGIKEKVLAAHRHGLQRVFLPEENRLNSKDLPVEVKDQMELVFHDSVAAALRDFFPASNSSRDSRDS